ncbi:MAG TPA: HAMP domain-containing sensor histidine kinase, partial [Niabella sp.]|nr:HAMP domain-containing sensor histidine kinase [Niabella sp.]
LLSPVRNGKGEVVGISTVARDITVRKMQEKQKDDFIAVASHELKTPVTVISAYTQLLQDRLQTVEDEESRSMIGKLAGQVEKLAGLIGVLLDTTKLAAGEMLLNLEELNLNDLIDEQVEIFSLLLARCRIEFKPGAIKKVMADRKLITRVISNIISNAGKYSPSGGMIIIATRSIGEHVEISVQDFGVGIPVSEQYNIFGRYFRVNASDVTAASGLGLGLYISVGILQQHGGNIRVESKEGSGSTFFITLPYPA